MKLSKTTLFKSTLPRAETLLDKTTRLAQEITDDDAEQRHLKTARLRKARLEKEAGISADAPRATTDGAGKKPRGKAAIKR